MNAEKNARFKHLRTFTYDYEISLSGVVRKQTTTGYLVFDRIDEDNGSYVLVVVNGEVRKCLIAELVLLTYGGTYEVGKHRIIYRDGNIHNVHFSNIKSKKLKVDDHRSKDEIDLNEAGIWRCHSRASSANSRFASKREQIQPIDVLRLLIVSNYNCYYCGNRLSPHNWQLDHFIPVSKGGRNEFDNLRCACSKCNIMKSDLLYDDFARMAYKVAMNFIAHNPESTLTKEHNKRLFSEHKIENNG